jgi:hypothetical protein
VGSFGITPVRRGMVYVDGTTTFPGFCGVSRPEFILRFHPCGFLHTFPARREWSGGIRPAPTPDAGIQPALSPFFKNCPIKFYEQRCTLSPSFQVRTIHAQQSGCLLEATHFFDKPQIP